MPFVVQLDPKAIREVRIEHAPVVASQVVLSRHVHPQRVQKPAPLNPRRVGRSWVRREHTPLVVDCWLAFKHDRLLAIHKLLVIDLMPVDLVVFAQEVLDLQAITDWVRVAIRGVKPTFKAGGKPSPPRA